jgi:hypothetical protein
MTTGELVQVCEAGVAGRFLRALEGQEAGRVIGLEVAANPRLIAAAFVGSSRP